MQFGQALVVACKEVAGVGGKHRADHRLRLGRDIAASGVDHRLQEDEPVVGRGVVALDRDDPLLRGSGGGVIAELRLGAGEEAQPFEIVRTFGHHGPEPRCEIDELGGDVDRFGQELGGLLLGHRLARPLGPELFERGEPVSERLVGDAGRADEGIEPEPARDDDRHDEHRRHEGRPVSRVSHLRRALVGIEQPPPDLGANRRGLCFS